ncbi:tetraspanin-17 [Biomphalaria glabrata]|uniref:Tetraspanin n=1 Tax=Biomphalaria glabrata TaxID=6526 RepID=A0A2C9JG08_BIOGL|nr:tetraspanin-17-like [Biomphalaria glabrata]KAI8797553.1 tetraspanin-17 [Biomphalaria glabrata]
MLITLQVIGLLLLAIGLWAWSEKDVFHNVTRLTNLALDPALVFIVVGMSMFCMSFTGCVGALRENTCLLLFFMISLGIMFSFELLVGILGFVYKDWVRDSIQTQVKYMIINYRDDLDLNNFVDWVQRDWLNCCGVQNFRDWEANIYFNCSSPGVEACGVPFSCCKPKAEEELTNRHCGFEIMKSDHEFDRATRINTIGCIPAGEKWLETNLIPVAGAAVGVALLQILGICFAQNLRSDIQSQKAKWTL